MGAILLFLGARIFSKKLNKANPPEIADIIDRFLQGKSASWEWDDFISCPISDSVLDNIRKQCGKLNKEYPPQLPGEYCSAMGIEVLKEIVLRLRSIESAQGKGDVVNK